MTAGDLYPFLEYSVVQVGSKGQIHSYYATGEALIEPCLKPISSGELVVKKKQSLIRFLSSQEPCCEKDNESMYICSAGYKAIIVSDKMLLMDSPITETFLRDAVQRCPLFQSSLWLGSISFYVLFVMLCLPEYERQLSRCSHTEDTLDRSLYVNVVKPVPSLQLVQKELDMLCSQLSLLSQQNNHINWMIAFNGEQQDSLFKPLHELRKRVGTLQKELDNSFHQHFVLLEKTRLIVYSFFFNILLCAVLMGSTSANSFGTNLNIPLYQNSATGTKALLWYIVSFSSILVASCFVFLFFRRNKMVIRYIIAANNHKWGKKNQLL
ncbi:hypothetical protein GpartN1_g6676.t1 [Galdieria partita]|uniref:Uncharacterized protein n=1 Tax=Galdieria partita TaxID=83374 RepID=A0A9C7Q2K3_9RHOD|nr:hypothetical protein GpartN1_g6676.t1 [Galdieria partita]